jgi:general secretion pathway protein F
MPIGGLSTVWGLQMANSSADQPFTVRSVLAGEQTVREQTLWAADVAAARQQLVRQGHVVISCHPQRRLFGLTRLFERSPQTNYAPFCRELRTLLAAGMTAVEAVDTLGMHADKVSAQLAIAKRLKPNLEAGLSVSEALFLLGDAPQVLLASIKAGERTSDLVKSLDDYLAYQSLVEGLRQKVISASVYPVVVTVFGVLISLFLLLYVLPQFAVMYQNLRGSQAAAQSKFIGFSLWVQANQWLFVTMCAACGVGLYGWISRGWAKRHMLALAARIPMFAARIDDFNIAMVFQAMVLLLRGGYTVTESLGIAGRVAGAAAVRERLAKALASVEQGQNIAATLKDNHLCDEVDARLLAAGERNGEFHQSLEVVASIHRERFELFVQRLSRIIEPILLLLVALLVGTIVVVMYLPIFDMAGRLR